MQFTRTLPNELYVTLREACVNIVTVVVDLMSCNRLFSQLEDEIQFVGLSH